MARFERRPSGGHHYAVVVEDFPLANGSWAKRTTKSFGRLTPETERKARVYAAVLTARAAFNELAELLL